MCTLAFVLAFTPLLCDTLGMSEKDLGGRPPIFNTPEELDFLVDQYIESGEVLTVTGLALKLGFADRASIYDYRKRPGFSHSIKRALLLVENGYEKRLGDGKPVGAIFALKNMGWRDSQHIEHSGALEIKSVSLDDLEKHIQSDDPREE